ncbi:MAG: MATE family efflux transporter, partial [Erysipelotrichaceae bacterium]|nr:MATE family efflux transporter [Erysipelotrichaceae bacterium]
MSRKISKDLTQGKVINVLLEFAWPIMLSNLVQTAYSMADMAIIGRFGSDVALAAVSNGTSVGNLFVNTASGFATAGQVITAQNMSKKDSQRMNDIIGTLFSFVAVFGILFTIICLALKPYLMNWLNVPQQAYDQSSYYIIVTAVGLLFIFGYHMVSGILRGLGNSKKPMQYITIAAVLNVLFDIIFIGYFHLEALGAALATVLAQGSAFVLCLIYLYRNREAFGFDFRVQSFRLRPEYLREMIVLGIPIAFQSLSGSFSTLYVSSLVNPYGIAASAITGVGSKLANIALIMANSLNVSSAAMIGQCYGQKNAARIRKIFLTVFAIDFTYVTLLSLAVLKYPVALFSLF